MYFRSLILLLLFQYHQTTIKEQQLRYSFMKTKSILLVLGAVAFVSCKKNYTCACGYAADKDNWTPVFQVHDTRKNAEKKCNDYRKDHVAIPENTCDLK